MKKHLVTFISLLFSMLPVCAGEIWQVEGTDGLYVFNKPINRTTTYVGELRQGAKVEVVGKSRNTWSKIIYKGDTCYVKTRYLVPGNEETLANTPEWQHPGKRKNTYASINWYFSTDRIMEALPDFRILHDKLPFNPDYCLIIAVILLVIATIALFFMEDGLSFGDTNYWILYALAIIISACELIYFWGSRDPLGFCDINNEWFVAVICYFILIAYALNYQLKLFTTLLSKTEEDTGFTFGTGITMIAIFLCTVYSVAYIILYHLDETMPSWLNWAVLALAALPLLSMLYRAIISRRISPLFVLVPFYTVAGLATFTILAIIGTALVVVLATWFILSVLYFFIVNAADFKPYPPGFESEGHYISWLRILGKWK